MRVAESTCLHIAAGNVGPARLVIGRYAMGYSEGSRGRQGHVLRRYQVQKSARLVLSAVEEGGPGRAQEAVVWIIGCHCGRVSSQSLTETGLMA